jgi:RNA polymerase sigma factor (TIGR02999 family)
MSDITLMLAGLKRGDEGSADDLLRLVYEELRKIAAWKMANESAAYTLQPTALVHEAWLRLTASEGIDWQNRAHFFGAAAEAMRRILIDHARRRNALRRGGDLERVELDDLDLAAPVTVHADARLLALDEALQKLALEDPAKAELIRLRYYAGLTIEDAAETMGISEATAKRWWSFSRAWLYAEMQRK